MGTNYTLDMPSSVQPDATIALIIGITRGLADRHRGTVKAMTEADVAREAINRGLALMTSEGARRAVGIDRGTTPTPTLPIRVAGSKPGVTRWTGGGTSAEDVLRGALLAGLPLLLAHWQSRKSALDGGAA